MGWLKYNCKALCGATLVLFPLLLLLLDHLTKREAVAVVLLGAALLFFSKPSLFWLRVWFTLRPLPKNPPSAILYDIKHAPRPNRRGS